jgi:hypothetical protein
MPPRTTVGITTAGPCGVRFTTDRHTDGNADPDTRLARLQITECDGMTFDSRQDHIARETGDSREQRWRAGPLPAGARAD